MGMPINYLDTGSVDGAKTLIKSYLMYGTNNHLDYNNELFYGHKFTRLELKTLSPENDSSNIFAMLALNGSGINNHLRLVLSRVDASGNIDTNGLRISQNQPHNGSIGHFPRSVGPLNSSDSKLSLHSAIKSLNSYIANTQAAGGPILRDDFYLGLIKYLIKEERNSLYLYDQSGTLDKIKGYTITKGDLEALDIYNTQGSDTDEYIFIPFLRTTDENETPEPKPYLSFGVVRISQGNIINAIREYFSPCPDSCYNYLSFIS